MMMVLKMMMMMMMMIMTMMLMLMMSCVQSVWSVWSNLLPVVYNILAVMVHSRPTLHCFFHHSRFCVLILNVNDSNISGQSGMFFICVCFFNVYIRVALLAVACATLVSCFVSFCQFMLTRHIYQSALLCILKCRYR